MDAYRKGLLITVLGVFVISPDVLLIRLMGADTFTILFWRGLLSGLAILAVYWALTGRGFAAGLRAQGLAGIGIMLVFCAGTFCFLYAATHTQAANTLFISSTAPVFAAILSLVFLGEVVPLRTWVTIGLTMLGIGIIAAGSLQPGGGSLDGDLAALGAAISMAATFTIARARRALSMVPAMGLAGLLTAVLALPLAPGVQMSGPDILWMALLGLVVVPGGFGLLTTGPRYLPAPDVSLIMLLEAVLGPLLVYWVLHEHPGNHALLGGGLILTVLALSSLRDWRRAARRDMSAQ